MREVCVDSLLRNPVVIGGPKNHQGRHLPHQLIFGGSSRDTGENFTLAVPDRSAATLMPIITQYILPVTTIMSDQWRVYNGIAAAPCMGYTQETVNHSLHFINPNTDANTQRIERSWKSAKERSN